MPQTYEKFIVLCIAGDLRFAVGTDVLNVHLHSLFPPEFIHLGNKRHIHHIPLNDRGRLRGG